MKEKMIQMVFLTSIIILVISLVGGCAQKQESGESGQLTDGVREIKVRAFQFGFEPDPIIANKGEKVKLIITSTDVTHGFAIDELGIDVDLPPNEPVVVEFVAEKGGKYFFYCSVPCDTEGKVGHAAQTGWLVIR